MAGSLLHREEIDSMNRVQTYLLGNTIEDCIISIAIFIASVFIARHAYHILRRAVSKWVSIAQTELGERRVIRVCTLIACTIPIIGFALASNRLILDENLSFWIANVLFISGQIVFLLILVNILPSLVKIASNNHLFEIII